MPKHSEKRVDIPSQGVGGGLELAPVVDGVALDGLVRSGGVQIDVYEAEHHRVWIFT